MRRCYTPFSLSATSQLKKEMEQLKESHAFALQTEKTKVSHLNQPMAAMKAKVDGLDKARDGVASTLHSSSTTDGNSTRGVSMPIRSAAMAVSSTDWLQDFFWQCNRWVNPASTWASVNALSQSSEEGRCEECVDDDRQSFYCNDAETLRIMAGLTTITLPPTTLPYHRSIELSALWRCPLFRYPNKFVSLLSPVSATSIPSLTYD